MADDLKIKFSFDEADFKRQVKQASALLAKGMSLGGAGGLPGRIAGAFLPTAVGGFGIAGAASAAATAGAAAAALTALEARRTVSRAEEQRQEAASMRIGLGELRRSGRQDVVPEMISAMNLVSQQFQELGQDLNQIRTNMFGPVAEFAAREATQFRRGIGMAALRGIAAIPGAIGRAIDPVGRAQRTAEQQAQFDARDRLIALRRLSFVQEGTRESVQIEIR